MAVQIQMRRGTASQWESANPTLAAGEWGLETDTDKFKIGDGSTAWNSITTYSSLGVGTAGGTFAGTINFGSDGSGQDVNFYSDTAGDSMVWDSSAESLTITGTDGQTALNVADGNVVIADSLTAGTITSGTVTMGDDRIDGAIMKDYSETVHAGGNTGSTETLDETNGNVQSWTLDASCTFTMPSGSGLKPGTSLTLILTQDGTGSRTGTFTGVKWAGGTAVTLSTGAADVDILTFTTFNGGSSPVWYGFTAGLDMS